MSLKLNQKQVVVDSLSKIVSNSTSVIAADYRGLKSTDMTELRSRMRDLGHNVKLKVVRNTLAKRALTGTNYALLTENLVGPVLLVFAKDEVSLVARFLQGFAKEKDKLTVVALVVEGSLFSGKQLSEVASLPTKEEALAKLVAVIQAPVAKLVRTMAEPCAKLARTLVAISNNKK